MTRAVLVTGGAGFIGSHTCKGLAAAGYLPVTVDNLSRGFRHAVRWGPLEEGDIADRTFLDTVMEKWRPQSIVHFAAYAYVGESHVHPDLYYRNNVAGSLSLLEAAQAHAIGRIVFSSTCATYGQAERMPIVETTPQKPESPYGHSKLMVERMLSDFGQAYGLRSLVLRYFNAAGADPDGEVGENHDPEPHLIPLALAAALGNGPPLRIFGTDYPTPDGTCIRDYVHVTDLADAHVRALAYAESEGNSAAINLGTGVGISVREIIASVERTTGRNVPHQEAPRRAGDVPVLIADSSLAQALLGWTPRYSSVDTIVAHAHAWERRRQR